MKIRLFDLLGYVTLIVLFLILFPQQKEMASDLADHLIPFIFLYLGGFLMDLLFYSSKRETHEYIHPDHPIPEPQGEE